MTGQFRPGEKILIGKKLAIIVRRHQYKRNVWYVHIPGSGYGWFDEKDITKIEPIRQIMHSSQTKQIRDRIAISRQKHSKKGIRRDFLMLNE